MGVPFVLALVLAVRPISVFLGTIGSKWNIRERTFVGFVAPRGIVAASVASVFGLKLASVGHAEELDVVFAKADLLVPVTFLTILGTVLICGMGAGPLARKLRLADANPQGILFAGASRWAREFATTLKAAGIRSVLVDTNFGNVTAARMAGLTATCGNILSEHVRDEQDLAGIGRFLAVTPSDEVNTLATMELMHLFTRAEVYQISSGGKQHSRWESIPENRRGRTLFSSDITHRQLDAMLDAGAVIKLTLLTKEFPMSAFEQRHGQGMIPIAAITEEGQLRLRVASRALDPLPGESIVAIVPSPSAEKTLDSSSSTAEQDADNQENDLI
jgi:CPA1 family monovalent cation:H+ antiporter